MTAVEAPVIERTYGPLPCGFCTSGLHNRCPVAIWNPGSGKVVTPAIGSIPAVRAGEAIYCPCQDDSHDEETEIPKCRLCGRTDQSVTEQLVCADAADCALSIEQRLANDPIHQLIVACRTTRIENGEVVERNRRPTPVEKAAAKAKREQAKARPCTCGCEGTTKGGAFLPGHDARFVSIQVQAVQATLAGQRTSAKTRKAAIEAGRQALAPFPKLLAKFNNRM